VRARVGLLLSGVLLAVLLRSGAPADPAPISHDDTFSKAGLFKADVATLKDTELVPHPDTPLRDNENVLWCGTFQLAWNQAITLVGEKLHFVSQPPLVNLLNLESFTAQDLDPASYVAVADFERNNVEDEIRAALERTFQGAASPELIPPKPPHPGPDDFVAYAYLYKNLAFPQPFADNEALSFGAQKVENFGFVRDKDKLDYGVFRQVSIYDYQSKDDFIIQLKTKSPEDELILAKVAPAKTLQATIQYVMARMGRNKAVPANKRDTLAIPKLNFDLREDFGALEGLVLQPTPAARVKSPLVIAKAEQLVRFQLNEKGAILKSEAVIVMVAAVLNANAPQPRQMIFDKPFLILMKQAKADQPYFALWVGNASLLVPAGGG
jgi:hypothetical protein